MYNAEIKTKFVRDYTQNLSVADFCESLFKAVGSFEDEYQKDFASMTSEELHNVLEYVVGARSKSKWKRVGILHSYVKWCIANGYDFATDTMLFVDAEEEDLGLSKIRKQYVCSPLHLQVQLDVYFEPEHENTVDNTFRCFYWLLYSGLREDEIVRLKASDISYESMSVFLDGEEIPLCRESIKSIRSCATSKDFIYKHPHYQTSLPRVTSDCILRGIKGDFNLLTFKNVMSGKQKRALKSNPAPVHLSANRVWTSGVFYRAYELERAGLPVDFSRLYRINKSQKSSAAKAQVLYDIKEDYIRWKTAFDL